MFGKCPKCSAIVTRVTLADLDVDSGGGRTWRGIAYLCPFCFSILSAAIDPIALRTDTVAGVVAETKKRKR